MTRLLSNARTGLALCCLLGPGAALAAGVVQHKITVSIDEEGGLRAEDRVVLEPGTARSSLHLGPRFRFTPRSKENAVLHWTGSLPRDGVFLRGSGGWYPRGEEKLSRISIRAGSLPKGWSLVAPVADRLMAPAPLIAAPFEKISIARHGRRLTIYAERSRAPRDLRRLLGAIDLELDRLVGKIGPFPFASLTLVEHSNARGVVAPGLIGLTSTQLEALFVDSRSLTELLISQWWGQGVCARARGDTELLRGIALYLADDHLGVGASAERVARESERVAYDRAEAARPGSHRQVDGAECFALTLRRWAQEVSPARVQQALRELYASRGDGLVSRQIIDRSFARALGRARYDKLRARGAPAPMALERVPANLARVFDWRPDLVVICSGRGPRFARAARRLAGVISRGARIVNAAELSAEQLNSTAHVVILGRVDSDVIARTGLVLPHDLRLGDELIEVAGHRRHGRSAGVAIAIEHGNPGEGGLVLIDALSPAALSAVWEAIDPQRSYRWLLLDSAAEPEYGHAPPLPELSRGARLRVARRKRTA